MDLDLNALNRSAPAAKPAAADLPAAPKLDRSRADFSLDSLTISEREFPLPGEVSEADEALPSGTLDRADALGRLITRAFDYPPPPPPPFLEDA